MSADELESTRAALRAAGGQEKPSDPHPDTLEWTRDIPTEDHAAMVEAWQDRHPAAPVGGQAEPSDAQIEWGVRFVGDADPTVRFPLGGRARAVSHAEKHPGMEAVGRTVGPWVPAAAVSA